jgi:tRNA-dihydrouridine synthase
MVDLTRLAEVYRQAREHDREAKALREEGKAIMVAARLAGVSAAKLATVAQVNVQWVYAILKAQPGGTNGDGST